METITDTYVLSGDSVLLKETKDKGSYINDNDERVYRVPGIGEMEHTAKIRIDYIITDSAFNESDFVIINI